MRIGKYVIHLHPMSVHFTNALYPVSLLFLALYLATKEESYRTTYGYIIALAALSTPVSFATGYAEWRKKYHAARVRVFSRKIRFGILLMAVGATCALWYWIDHGVLSRGGIASLVFTALNFAVLPLAVTLGYLGGNLVHWRPH
jgi:uncharacterized membrane protein